MSLSKDIYLKNPSQFKDRPWLLLLSEGTLGRNVDVTPVFKQNTIPALPDAEGWLGKFCV